MHGRMRSFYELLVRITLRKHKLLIKFYIDNENSYLKCIKIYTIVKIKRIKFTKQLYILVQYGTQRRSC